MPDSGAMEKTIQTEADMALALACNSPGATPLPNWENTPEAKLAQPTVLELDPYDYNPSN